MRIEATTSSVASVLPIHARGGIEEVAASRPTAVDDDRKVFVNPKLLFDDSALALIVQIRDLETGDVTRQFPSKEVVERYRRQVEAGERGVVVQPSRTGESENADRGEQTEDAVTLPGREATDETDGVTGPEAQTIETPAPRATATEGTDTTTGAGASSSSGGEAARATERSTVV